MIFEKHFENKGYDIIVDDNIILFPNELKVEKIGLEIVNINNKKTFGILQTCPDVLKRGILCEGAINNEYKGEIVLTIKNLNNKIVCIDKKTKIAQIIFFNCDNVCCLKDT